MRLEDVAVRLRSRNPYEAIDLGYAMVRSWRRHVFPIWASVYLTAAVVISLICFTQPIIATILLWWLKPLSDRVILHLLAGIAFGAPPTLRQTWQALPRLWNRNGVFAALTWRRLDTARSFSLPVTQLEGQSGKPARARRAVLGREGRAAAVWLTIISAHFEILIVLGVYAFAPLFLPGDVGELNPFIWMFEPPPDWMQHLTNGVTVLVVLCLEPFYVAGGFALYLNTRTVLEGWDIELSFKRMSKRIASDVAKMSRTRDWVLPDRGAIQVLATEPQVAAHQVSTRRSGHTVTSIGVVLMAGVLSFWSATSSHDAVAQRPVVQSTPPSPSPAPPTPERAVDRADQPVGACKASDDDTEVAADSDDPSDGEPASKPASWRAMTPKTGAQDLAQKILADPEFGSTRQTWAVKYIGPGSKPNKEEKPTNWDWLKTVGEWFAFALRALAWGLGAAAIVALLYVLVRKLDGTDWRPRRARLDTLFGMDVRPDSLPHDLTATARLAMQRGDLRAALSLLYRGALVSLLADGRIDIERGDTEGVCVLRVARSYGSTVAAKPTYFKALVNAWQHVAYAGKPLNVTVVADLIDQWAMHFSVTSEHADTTTPAGDVSAARAA